MSEGRAGVVHHEGRENHKTKEKTRKWRKENLHAPLDMGDVSFSIKTRYDDDNGGYR